MLFVGVAVRPDHVLELGWKHGWMDIIMPFMIQFVREYSDRVDALDKKVESFQDE